MLGKNRDTLVQIDKSNFEQFASVLLADDAPRRIHIDYAGYAGEPGSIERFSNKHMEFVVSTLLQAKVTLEELDLSIYDNVVDDEGMQELIKLFTSPQCPHHLSVILFESNISGMGLKLMAEQLQAQYPENLVLELNLAWSRNQQDWDVGVEALAHFLEGRADTSQLTIDISNNKISDIALAQLFKALQYEHGSQDVDLNISGLAFREASMDELIRLLESGKGPKCLRLELEDIFFNAEEVKMAWVYRLTETLKRVQYQDALILAFNFDSVIGVDNSPEAQQKEREKKIIKTMLLEAIKVNTSLIIEGNCFVDSVYLIPGQPDTQIAYYNCRNLLMIDHPQEKSLIYDCLNFLIADDSLGSINYQYEGDIYDSPSIDIIRFIHSLVIQPHEHKLIKCVISLNPQFLNIDIMKVLALIFASKSGYPKKIGFKLMQEWNKESLDALLKQLQEIPYLQDSTLTIMLGAEFLSSHFQNLIVFMKTAALLSSSFCVDFCDCTLPETSIAELMQQVACSKESLQKLSFRFWRNNFSDPSLWIALRQILTKTKAEEGYQELQLELGELFFSELNIVSYVEKLCDLVNIFSTVDLSLITRLELSFTLLPIHTIMHNQLVGINAAKRRFAELLSVNSNFILNIRAHFFILRPSFEDELITLLNGRNRLIAKYPEQRLFILQRYNQKLPEDFHKLHPVLLLKQIVALQVLALKIRHQSLPRELLAYLRQMLEVFSCIEAGLPQQIQPSLIPLPFYAEQLRESTVDFEFSRNYG